ncbi:MAG: hypothetical protein OEY63_06215 [Gemmatimonadota bacterium]|nr:hypothetical protein [Gemmatimonadota bacterium]
MGISLVRKLAYAVCVASLAICALGIHEVRAQENRVVPIHLVPADFDFDPDRFRLNVRALSDVRAWYGRALGDHTFPAEPMVVHWSKHSFDSLAGNDFQNWWPLLQDEFAEYGMNWRDSSNFKLLFLAQGAGAWAGADSENGGIESMEDAGRTDDGNWGGLAIVGDSSIAGVLAGVCPWDGLEDGTAWWCNWDTYRGTIAHELGHTFGIPHPSAFMEDQTLDCMTEGDTVMQCHWGFPYDSLLPFERTHMRSLRFFPPTEEAEHELLVERLPFSATPGVRFYRGERSSMPRIRREGGALTGYPFGISMPGNSTVEWRIGHVCRTLTMDIGRDERSGGRGTVTVTSGEDSFEATFDPNGPTRFQQVVCGDNLRISVTGQRRFRAVIGNPRLVGE